MFFADLSNIFVQRTKMLVALGEVEQKLRHDADFVAEQAVSEELNFKHLPRVGLVEMTEIVCFFLNLQVRSVQVESECQFKQMMEFTSA